MKKRIKLRFFLIFLAFIIGGFFLWRAVVPFGQIIYTTNFESQSRFIRKITPEERVLTGDGRSLIIGDPVYFSLWIPRTFDKAELKIKYENKSPGILEAGVLADNKFWRYDLEPLENKFLDKLILDWPFIRENDLILLQRPEAGIKFQSINGFLKELPERSRIGVYNFEIKKDFSLPDYESDEKEINLNYFFRGSWEILTYIKEEDLNISVDFFDLNKNEDCDEIKMILYFHGEPIDRVIADKDEICNDAGEKQERKSLNIGSSGLPEGVYKIELRANNDIISKNIKTDQSKIVFRRKLEFYNSGLENIEIFTNSSSLKTKTVNPDSLQKILINSDTELDLDETYSQFEVDFQNQGLNSVKVKKDGLVLESEGFFAFSREQFFNPEFSQIKRQDDLVGVDYVLARYEKPENKEGGKEARAEFDLKRAYREKSKYGFLISAPEASRESPVIIKKIQIKLQGRSLFEKLKEILLKRKFF